MQLRVTVLLMTRTRWCMLVVWQMIRVQCASNRCILLAASWPIIHGDSHSVFFCGYCSTQTCLMKLFSWRLYKQPWQFFSEGQVLTVLRLQMVLQQIDCNPQFYKHRAHFLPLSIMNECQWNRCIRGLCAFSYVFLAPYDYKALSLYALFSNYSFHLCRIKCR
jgi:hypothetical protein